MRALRALQCSTAATPMSVHDREQPVRSGPATIADGSRVRWDVPSVATATIDYNGYFPDGQFEFGYGSGGMTYANFDEMQSAGAFERHGTFLASPSGIDDWTVKLDPMTPVLGAGSPAIDHAELMPNIDDGFTGNAADLGALELGCDPPIYGPRPDGMDETNEPTGCIPPGTPSDDVAHGDDVVETGNSHGGCCQGAPASSNFALVLGVLVALRRRYKRRASDTTSDVSIR